MTEVLPPKKQWFVEIRSKILRKVDFLRILHTVYDPEVEGISFDEASDDFVCPLCGVGKDEFSKE